jgi:hypothetical protein
MIEMREKIASAGLIASMLLGVLGTSFGIVAVNTMQDRPTDQTPDVYNTYNNQTFVNNTYINNTTHQQDSIAYTPHFMNVTATIDGNQSVPSQICTIPLVNRTRLSVVVIYTIGVSHDLNRQYPDCSCLIAGKVYGADVIFGSRETHAWAVYPVVFDDPQQPYFPNGLPNATGLVLNVTGWINPYYPGYHVMYIAVAIWYETW